MKHYFLYTMRTKFCLVTGISNKKLLPPLYHTESISPEKAYLSTNFAQL